MCNLKSKMTHRSFLLIICLPFVVESFNEGQTGIGALRRVSQFSASCRMPWPFNCYVGQLSVEYTCEALLTRVFYSVKCPKNSVFDTSLNDDSFWEYLRNRADCFKLLREDSDLTQIVSWKSLREDKCLNYDYLRELCYQREICKECQHMLKFWNYDLMGIP